MSCHTHCGVIQRTEGGKVLCKFSRSRGDMRQIMMGVDIGAALPRHMLHHANDAAQSKAIQDCAAKRRHAQWFTAQGAVANGGMCFGHADVKHG